MVAARAMGASDLRIMFGHILPNIISLLFVTLSAAMGRFNSGGVRIELHRLRHPRANSHLGKHAKRRTRLYAARSPFGVSPWSTDHRHCLLLLSDR